METRELRKISSPKRRLDYLAGRWLARNLIAESLIPVDPDKLEILSRDETGRPTHPTVYLSGCRCENVQLSISHSGIGLLVAAVGTTDYRIGCDLVSAIPIGRGFRETWFTEAERAGLDHPRGPDPLWIWAAKESAYKAFNKDEPFSPRRLNVTNNRSDEWICEYRIDGILQICQIYRLNIANETAALATFAGASAPVQYPNWKPAGTGQVLKANHR